MGRCRNSYSTNNNFAFDHVRLCVFNFLCVCARVCECDIISVTVCPFYGRPIQFITYSLYSGGCVYLFKTTVSEFGISLMRLFLFFVFKLLLRCRRRRRRRRGRCFNWFWLPFCCGLWNFLWIQCHDLTIFVFVCTFFFSLRSNERVFFFSCFLPWFVHKPINHFILIYFIYVCVATNKMLCLVPMSFSRFHSFSRAVWLLLLLHCLQLLLNKCIKTNDVAVVNFVGTVVASAVCTIEIIH